MEFTDNKDLRFLYKGDAMKRLYNINKSQNNNCYSNTNDFTGYEYEYWMGSLYHQDFESTITKTEERLKFGNRSDFYHSLMELNLYSQMEICGPPFSSYSIPLENLIENNKSIFRNFQNIYNGLLHSYSEQPKFFFTIPCFISNEDIVPSSYDKFLEKLNDKLQNSSKKLNREICQFQEKRGRECDSCTLKLSPEDDEEQKQMGDRSILWKSGVIQPNREKICNCQLECFELPSYIRIRLESHSYPIIMKTKIGEIELTETLITDNEIDNDINLLVPSSIDPNELKSLVFTFKCPDKSRSFYINIKKVLFYDEADSVYARTTFRTYIEKLTTNYHDKLDKYTFLMLRICKITDLFYPLISYISTMLQIDNKSFDFSKIKEEASSFVKYLEDKKQSLFYEREHNLYIKKNPIRTIFEPTYCTAGIRIKDGIHLSSDKSNIKYNYAILNYCLSYPAVYEWKFLITKLDEKDEIYFGISKKTYIEGVNIEECGMIYLYSTKGNRVFNGRCLEYDYVKPMIENDVISLLYVETSHALYISINNDLYVPFFSLSKGNNIYPIVLFNGNSKVSLLSFTETRDSKLLIAMPNVNFNNDYSTDVVKFKGNINYDAYGYNIEGRNDYSLSVPCRLKYYCHGYVAMTDKDKDDIIRDNSIFIKIYARDSDGTNQLVYGEKPIDVHNPKYEFDIKIENMCEISFVINSRNDVNRCCIAWHNICFLNKEEYDKLYVERAINNTSEFMNVIFELLKEIIEFYETIPYSSKSISQIPIWYELSNKTVSIFNTLIDECKKDLKLHETDLYHVLYLMQMNFKQFILDGLSPKDNQLWKMADPLQLMGKFENLTKNIISLYDVINPDHEDLIKQLTSTIVSGYSLLFTTVEERISYFLKLKDNDKIFFILLERFSESPVMIYYLCNDDNGEIYPIEIALFKLLFFKSIGLYIDSIKKKDKNINNQYRILSNFIIKYQEQYLTAIISKDTEKKYVDIENYTKIAIKEYILKCMEETKKEKELMDYTKANYYSSPIGEFVIEFISFIKNNLYNQSIIESINQPIIELCIEHEKYCHILDSEYDNNDIIMNNIIDNDWIQRDFISPPTSSLLSLEDGSIDNKTCNMGYFFKPKVDLVLYSLGRAVSLRDNLRQLHSPHVIRLIDQSTKEILSSVVVNSKSQIDSLGFASEGLLYPLILRANRTYFIYSTEIYKSNDPYKITNRIDDIHYRTDLIDLVTDISEDNSIEGFNKFLINYTLCTLYIFPRNQKSFNIQPYFELDGIEESELEKRIGPSVYPVISNAFKQRLLSSTVFHDVELKIIFHIISSEDNTSSFSFGLTKSDPAKGIKNCEIYTNNKGEFIYLKDKKYFVRPFCITSGSIIVLTINSKTFKLTVEYNNEIISESDKVIGEELTSDKCQLAVAFEGKMKFNCYVKDQKILRDTPLHYNIERLYCATISEMLKQMIHGYSIEDKYNLSWLLSTDICINGQESEGEGFENKEINDLTKQFTSEDQIAKTISGWFFTKYERDLLNKNRRIPATLEMHYLIILFKQTNNLQLLKDIIAIVTENKDKIEDKLTPEQLQICEAIGLDMSHFRKKILTTINNLRNNASEEDIDSLKDKYYKNVENELKYILSFRNKNEPIKDIIVRDVEAPEAVPTPRSNRILISNSIRNINVKVLNQFLQHYEENDDNFKLNELPVEKETVNINDLLIDFLSTVKDEDRLNSLKNIQENRMKICRNRIDSLKKILYMLSNIKSKICQCDLLHNIKSAFRSCNSNVTSDNLFYFKYSYDNGINGIGIKDIWELKQIFYDFFIDLYGLLNKNITSCNSLSYAILYTLSLDYKKSDLEMIFKIGFFNKLVDYEMICMDQNKEIDYCDILENWNLESLPTSKQLVELISDNTISIESVRKLLLNQKCLKDYITNNLDEFNDNQTFIMHYAECYLIMKKELRNRKEYEILPFLFKPSSPHKYNNLIISKYCHYFHLELLTQFISHNEHIKHRKRQQINISNNNNDKDNKDVRNVIYDRIPDELSHDIIKTITVSEESERIDDYIQNWISTYLQIHNPSLRNSLQVESHLIDAITFINIICDSKVQNTFLSNNFKFILEAIINGYPQLKISLIRFLSNIFQNITINFDISELLRAFLQLIGETYNIEKFNDEDERGITYPNGYGYNTQIIVSELIDFIRKLLTSNKYWNDIISDKFKVLLSDLDNQLSSYISNVKSSTKEVLICFGVLSVLGSSIEIIRASGKVLYKPTNQIGTVVSYDPLLNDIGIIFNESFNEEIHHYNSNNCIPLDKIQPPIVTDILLGINSDEVRDALKSAIEENEAKIRNSPEHLFILSSLKYQLFRFFSVQTNNMEIANKLASNTIMKKAFAIATGKSLDYTCDMEYIPSYIPSVSEDRIEKYVNEKHSRICELSNIKAEYNLQGDESECPDSFKMDSTVMHNSLAGYSIRACYEELKECESKFDAANRILGIAVDVNKDVKKYQITNVMRSNFVPKREISNSNGSLNYQPWYLRAINSPSDKMLCADEVHLNNNEYYNMEKRQIKRGLFVRFTGDGNNRIGVIDREMREESDRFVFVKFYNPLTGFQWIQKCEFNRLQYCETNNNKTTLVSRCIGYCLQLQRFAAQKVIMNVMLKVGDNFYKLLLTKFKTNSTSLPQSLYNLYALMVIRRLIENNERDDNITNNNNIVELAELERQKQSLQVFLLSSYNKDKNQLYNTFLKNAIKHLKPTYSIDYRSEIIRESNHPYRPQLSVESIFIEDADELLITFDRESQLQDDHTIGIYRDAECKELVKLFNKTTKLFESVVINSNLFYFKVLFDQNYTQAGVPIPIKSFGYKMRVYKINRPLWIYDTDILDPERSNRKWALWIIETLLLQPNEEIYQACNENEEFFNCLINSIENEPNVDVMKILLLILSTHCFIKPAWCDKLTPLFKEERIRELYNLTYLNMNESYKLAIENHYQYKRLKNMLIPLNKEKPTKDNFNFTYNKTNYLEYEKNPEKCVEYYPLLVKGITNEGYIDNQIFLYSWLNHKNSVRMIQTEHPIKDNNFTGGIGIDGTTNIFIYFDYRCRLPEGWAIHFEFNCNGTKNQLDINNKQLKEIRYTANSVKYSIKSNSNKPSDEFGIIMTFHLHGNFVKNDIIVSSKDRVLEDLETQHNWPKKADIELINYINENSSNSNGNTDHYISNQNTSQKYPIINDINIEDVDFRLFLLKLVNSYWNNFINNIDLKIEYPNALSKIGFNSFYLIDRNRKSCYLDQFIESTRVDEATTHVNIDNIASGIENGKKFDNPLSSHGMFIQLYLNLKDCPNQIYLKSPKTRLEGRFMGVTYMNEEGVDAGGLFRDCLHQSITNLFDPNINIMLPCFISDGAEEGDDDDDDDENGNHNGNDNNKVLANKFVPNPQLTSPQMLDIFKFIGRIIGVSIRLQLLLPFQLSNMIWKLIANREVTLNDLIEVDNPIVNYINELKSCDDDNFPYLVGDDAMCVINNFKGESIELIEGGSSISLTLENRREMCDIMIEKRLHEFDIQVKCIREGLLEVLPEESLYIFNGDELEYITCGVDIIDIDLLKQNTIYVNYKESDQVIRWYWRVMEELTNELRSQWIVFVWGRSRIPNTKVWSRKYRITRADNPNLLPKSHTCFFQLDLPMYRSYEEMNSRIRSALAYGNFGFQIE